MKFYIFATNREQTIKIERVINSFTEEIENWMQLIISCGYKITIKKVIS